MVTSELKVVFLGACERAFLEREGKTNLFKWNVLGLKNIILSYIFPLNLRNWVIGLAVNIDRIKEITDLKITDKEGKEVGFIKIQLFKNISPNSKSAILEEYGTPVLVPKNTWSAVFLPIKESDIVISQPGIYNICLSERSELSVIGQLDFALVDPPPLTQERIAAIKSDPTAVKAVKMILKCKKCPSIFKSYASLGPNTDLERNGYIKFNKAPDEFICACKNTHIDLKILKKNLHGFLGTKSRKRDELDFIPLYERSALEGVLDRLTKLIVSNPNEEELQKFIQKNPIMLHQFPAEKIFFKPPLLSQFFADFGIVTPQKELILIEIEKTDIRLMKKDGGIAAPLTHAIDQTRDWLHIANEHRLAVLDNLSINKDEVSSIRGIVIAGRDTGYNVHHMRKLKGTDLGQIRFLTYDDIILSLDILIRNIKDL